MIFNEVNVYEWLTFHQIHEQVSRYFSVLNNGILHFAETDAETAVVHYLTTFFPSASIPASFNLPVSTLESAVFSVLAFSKVPEKTGFLHSNCFLSSFPDWPLTIVYSSASPETAAFEWLKHPLSG